MGLARDIIFARVIGADAFADVFFVAFKIPNFSDACLLRVPLLKPLFLFWVNTERRAAVRGLIDRVSGTIGLTLLIFTLIVILSAPLLAGLFAPRWF